MTDVLTPAQRKLNMSRIRDKNTKPEIAVRRLVHRLGFRFRLHDTRLPGKPDIVLKCHHKIIFVHGCFWHMHSCKYGKVKPKTNADFWEEKRNGNASRDKANLRELKKAGWQVLIIWECWVRNPSLLEKRVKKFLTS